MALRSITSILNTRSMKFPRQVILFLFILVGVFCPVQSIAEIISEGEYDGHLQGIARDGDGSIFWSFTVSLVKTDSDGKLISSVEVASHHGDLCYTEGVVYVAVNLGEFNELTGRADSWIYAYDANNLSLVWKRPIPEVVHGAGGVDMRNGHFFVVGGLPVGFEENYVYEYDSECRFVRRITVESGYTEMGIQTAFYSEGSWWLGCYGVPRVLIKTDDRFHFIGRRLFDASLGIANSANGDFMIGRDLRKSNGQHQGSIVFARKDEEDFLEVEIE